jgi:tetratricopeptide (TPR) repeat protein
VWSFNINVKAARDEEVRKWDETLGPVNERLQYITVLLNQVSEQQLISERAKGIAFRENERDALRRAIREDMQRKDYDAALVLANEIEAVFGYKQEADRFREEIYNSRDAEVRKIVNEVLGKIDRECQAENWTGALREAERLMAMLPNDAQVRNLPNEIEARRQGHKRQLLEGYTDAVARHDVDGWIEILKRLDPYLTPVEAEQLQESARQMFKDKLMLLGQQFTLAVRDHNWNEAIRVGDSIVKEFPNSRMATEVRDKMELLKQRAGEMEAVG